MLKMPLAAYCTKYIVALHGYKFFLQWEFYNIEHRLLSWLPTSDRWLLNIIFRRIIYSNLILDFDAVLCVIPLIIFKSTIAQSGD